MNGSLDEVTFELRHLKAQPWVARRVRPLTGCKSRRHRSGLRNATGQEMLGPLELGHARSMAGGAGQGADIPWITSCRLIEICVWPFHTTFVRLRGRAPKSERSAGRAEKCNNRPNGPPSGKRNTST